MPITKSLSILRMSRKDGGRNTRISSKLSVALALFALTILVVPVMVSTRSVEGKAAAAPISSATPQAQRQPTRPQRTRRGGTQRTPNSNSANINRNLPVTNENVNRNETKNTNTNENANRGPDSLQFKGLKATAGTSRGVIVGGMVRLELNTSVPTDRDLQVVISRLPEKADNETLVIHEYLEKEVLASVPAGVHRGQYEVTVYSKDNPAVKLQRPHYLYVEELGQISLYSSIPILLIAGIIVLIAFRYKTSQGEVRYNIFQLLFLEPKSQTYSLARTQFVLWMSAIALGYVFLFFAQGLVQDIWAFPSLAGFGITFLISLGTLVASQATDSAKGSKGAGAVDPSIADLFLHGGVLALDRVQQILWTVIAAGMFLWILVKNYAISTTVPEIPKELLILMGISSGGYIVGKMARKPGPIIAQILAGPGSVYLTIRGEHLSKDAFVWVDGRQLTDKAVISAADPDNPNEFAKELKVKVSDDASLIEWYTQDHNVLVVNSDSQRAEWRSTPAIESVEISSYSQSGDHVKETTVYLKIKGAYIGPDATWEVTGASFLRGGHPTPTSSPKEWQGIITAADTKQLSGEISVQTASGRASHSWTVASAQPAKT